jgi:hypothetical protein
MLTSGTSFKTTHPTEYADVPSHVQYDPLIALLMHDTVALHDQNVQTTHRRSN